MARSLNSAGTYSTAYASNTFVYDSLAPQTAVTLPVNSTYTSTLAQITGTSQDYPLGNPGHRPRRWQCSWSAWRTAAYWTGAPAPACGTRSVFTMGVLQGVSVYVSSWSVGSANLPAPSNLPDGPAVRRHVLHHHVGHGQRRRRGKHGGVR